MGDGGMLKRHPMRSTSDRTSWWFVHIDVCIYDRVEAIPGITGSRLNPFAFPSETTLRFVLLIMFALCGSASTYGSLWDVFNPQSNQVAAQCATDLMADMRSLSGTEDENVAAMKTRIMPKIIRCWDMLRPAAIWKLAGVTITVALAGGLYLLLPSLMFRLYGLTRVTESTSPGLLEELQDICRSVGITRVPIAVWNPLSVSMPYVFGHRRYYCAFSGAFVSHLYDDKALFRTVVLHELAHIARRDLWKTYLTVTTSVAFLVAVLVLFTTVFLVADVTWKIAFEPIATTVMWVLLITLAGASILRAREYYADVQTVAWEGTTANLDRIHANQTEAPTGRWRRYLDLHPTRSERRAVIADPSILFAFSAWDAFGVGIAAWYTIGVVKVAVSYFLPPDPWSMVIFQAVVSSLVPLLCMTFAAGAVGIGVWRAAFAALLLGKDAHRGTGRLGLALGASSLVPVCLTFMIVIGGGSDMTLASTLDQQLMDFGIGLIVGAGGYLLFRWLVEAVAAWLGVVLHSRSPRPVLLLTIIVTLILLTGTLFAGSYVVYFYYTYSRTTEPTQAANLPMLISVQVVGVPILLTSTLAWLFPLCARFCTRGQAIRRPPEWLLIGRSAPSLPAVVPWNIAAALKIGIAMGCIYALLVEMLMFRSNFPHLISAQIYAGYASLQSWIAKAAHGDDSTILIVAQGFIQVVAAVIAAASQRRFQVLSGLFAAFVAGLVIVIFTLLFLEFGQDYPLFDIVITAVSAIASGAMLALPFSVAVAWISGKLRTPAFETAFVDARSMVSVQRPGWRLLRGGLLASLCLTVMFGLVVRLHAVIAAGQEKQAVLAAAQGGDSAAQVRLGTMYLNGTSVRQSNSDAVFWLQKAAGAGNPDAIRVLGRMYSIERVTESDRHSVLDLLSSAAEKGNADAQNTLGWAFKWGQGVRADDTVALTWFRRAAEQDHPAALHNLAMMHHLGLGMTRDDPGAVKLLQRSAALGYAEAQFRLGRSFDVGDIVSRDETQAVTLLHSAAAQGYEPATKLLQEMCGRGVAAACP